MENAIRLASNAAIKLFDNPAVREAAEKLGPALVALVTVELYSLAKKAIEAGADIKVRLMNCEICILQQRHSEGE